MIGAIATTAFAAALLHLALGDFYGYEASVHVEAQGTEGSNQPTVGIGEIDPLLRANAEGRLYKAHLTYAPQIVGETPESVGAYQPSYLRYILHRGAFGSELRLDSTWTGRLCADGSYGTINLLLGAQQPPAPGTSCWTGTGAVAGLAIATGTTVQPVAATPIIRYQSVAGTVGLDRTYGRSLLQFSFHGVIDGPSNETMLAALPRETGLSASAMYTWSGPSMRLSRR